MSEAFHFLNHDFSNWQKIALFIIYEVNDDVERSYFLISNFSDSGKQCFARCSNIYTKRVKGCLCAVII